MSATAPRKMDRASDAHQVPSSGCCAVIGGSGFIGRHIVDACLREFDAVVIVDLQAPVDNAGGAEVPRRQQTLLAKAPPAWHSCTAVITTVLTTEQVRHADMCDPDQLSLALHGCAAVIHAAGVVDTRSGPWHDEHIHRLNVDGTAAVIEACRRAQPSPLTTHHSPLTTQPSP